MKGNMKHLALVLIVALLFNGCTRGSSTELPGNTQGNLLNEGWFAEQEGGFIAHFLIVLLVTQKIFTKSILMELSVPN